MEGARAASVGGGAASHWSASKADLQVRHPSISTEVCFSNAKRDQAFVSTYTMGILHALMAGAGVERIQVLSAYRTVAEQAQFMYRTMHHARPVFAGHATKVESVGKSMIRQIQAAMVVGHAAKPVPTPADIVAKMAEVIEELEQRHGLLAISRHREDPKNRAVLNIYLGPCSPTQHAAFLRRVSSCAAISRFGLPRRLLGGGADTATPTVGPWIHLEVPQR